LSFFSTSETELCSCFSSLGEDIAKELKQGGLGSSPRYADICRISCTGACGSWAHLEDLDVHANNSYWSESPF